MRVGIIRGDMPGPVLLADLESVSDRNTSTEAPGQVRYVGRPTVAEVEAALADATTGAGAATEGGTITFNLVVNGANDNLRLRLLAADAFVVYTIANATYTNLTDLLGALNTAINGSGITALANRAADGIILESNTKGVTSRVETDTVANGSNANSDLALPDGEVRTMVPAATLITDSLPVGGPLDVSGATVEGSGAGTATTALLLIPAARGTAAAVAEALAPQFTESPVLEDSMRNGYLNALLDAGFNPDPRRSPALADGAAIEVVQDDGTTAYTVGLPTVTSATLDSPGTGDVTIAGTDLSGPGAPTAERKEVLVKVTGTGTPDGGDLSLTQELIEANGGTVTATAIVLPAVLNDLTGWATTTTSVQVKHRSYASALEALA